MVSTPREAKKERIALFAATIIFSLVPSLFAQSNDPTFLSYSPTIGIAGIALIIAFSRRKKELGGWLLFYIIQLLGTYLFIVLSGLTTLIDFYDPSNWEERGLYLYILLTYAPILILGLGEFFIAVSFLFEKFRNQKMVRLLKFILALQAVIIVIRYVAYLIQPSFPSQELRQAIWPIIWFAYFNYSNRIRKVFITKEWGRHARPEHHLL